MNQLSKVFEGRQLRILDNGHETLFLLKDVCNILDLEQPAAVKRRLEDEVISNHPIKDSVGRNQTASFVSEDGLYDVILDSRKPEARKFRKWITSEVIPSIRKHGTYMTPDTIEKVLADPDTIIQIATQLKEERAMRQKAELAVQEQKPKVLFAESVESSKTSILIRELAVLLKQNGIDTGERRLYTWLRENGYLVRRHGSDRNMPTQRSMNLGLFEVKETPIHHNSGDIKVGKTTKVTGKGQVYFINKFLSERLAI